jgi:hypothetical protein
MRWRWISALIVSAVMPLCGVAAQVTEPVEWQLVNSRGGFCIWFLSDPEIARGLVPVGTALKTASETTNLPIDIMRIVQDEPRFAVWIPGVTCLTRFNSLISGGRQVAMGSEDRPLLMTLTAVAVNRALGTGAEWLLTEVGLDDGSIRREASGLGLPIKKRELKIRRGLEGEAEEWELGLEGVKLTWQGRLGTEKRVGETRSMSFGYVGARNITWLVDLVASPDTVQPPIGALMVAGRDPLAEAMMSSPIRAVTGAEQGGSLTMTFRKAP